MGCGRGSTTRVPSGKRETIGWRLALPLLAVLIACGGAQESEPRVIVDGTVLPSATATAEVATSTPEPLPFSPPPPASTLDPADLRGFMLPIEGGCLPGYDGLMPNAPRAYRNGVHEGVDWYDLSSCATIVEGTPVYAMYGGVVVRSDYDYLDLTPQQVAELADRTAQQGFSDPDTLDLYRGRQVWIDHGGGIITRYGHLGRIEDGGTYVGASVERGQVIAYVGESGTPESVTDPGTEMHLHAEVRVGDGFLGEGLPPDEVRRLWERLFGPAESAAQ